MLIDGNDPSMSELESVLQTRLNPFLCLPIQQLFKSRWYQTLGNQNPHWSLELPVGTLRSSEIRGVLTMSAALPADCVAHIKSSDRVYVYEEMSAALCSLLQSLDCPVLSKPWPYSLSGRALSIEEWRSTARRAGLPVAPLGSETNDPVGDIAAEALVVGERVVSADQLSDLHLNGVRRLAKLSRNEFFSVNFVRNSFELVFDSVRQSPDVMTFGQAGCDAVCDYLEAT